MKFPPHIVDVIGQSSVEIVSHCPPPVREAAVRLATDERMRPVWERGFSDGEFWYAVREFEQAIQRDHWTDKTQRERDAWLLTFEKTVNSLLELMSEAPRTPEAWGFPARDNVLMNVAYRMGVPLPPADDLHEFFRKMLDLEAAADAECWTIADALKHYREQQRSDCEAKQFLPRPGDVKAGRAQFIIMMRESTSLSASELATVASVMFEDEAIDDRLVRRLTAGRADSSRT